jgi:hypothetical protein
MLPIPRKDFLDKLDRLEGALREADPTSNERHEDTCPLKHIFTPGLYCREIYMPAGVVIVSKMHKTEHVFIISKGKVLVVTENDKKFLQAPHTGITKPGTKRALYIVEDTIWTTVHPIESQDLEEIEEALIAPSYEDYLLLANPPKQLELRGAN